MVLRRALKNIHLTIKWARPPSSAGDLDVVLHRPRQQINAIRHGNDGDYDYAHDGDRYRFQSPERDDDFPSA